MSVRVTMRRDGWLRQLLIAAASVVCALLLTHLFWHFLRRTPFLFGFAAATVSSRVGGRKAGFLSVILGMLGFALFPPSLPAEGYPGLLIGFGAVSGAFSWFVARRYEIEADLRANQERLRAVVSSLPIVLWVMDRDGCVTLAEGRGLDVLDARRRALVGSSVFEQFRDVPEIVANTRRALAGETFTAVVALDNVVIETWYSPLRDGHGPVTGAIGVSLDVTERHAAEKVLSRSERRLQTIIDAEPACVTIVSRDGLLLEMNRAGLEMVGAHDFTQVAGCAVIDLVHREDHDRFLEAHAAAAAGSPARCEFRMSGLGGVARWVDSHLVPFDVTSGSDVQRAVLSVASDVTERKQLEDKLRQSQKLEAIGLLAGGVAHDFNNLLTAISGYTEFVLNTFDANDRRREDLQEVVKAGRRAAALTRQLLAVSRRQLLQPTVLDVNAMVADLQKLLHRTIPENIEIQLELSPALDPVRADRGQLEQVVLNLAINAGDAMPQGGRLRLTTATVDVGVADARRRQPMQPGRYVRLTVSDTGTGMAPETQAHIFEPFFTTKPRGKGTGLGLATVYGIVKQSDGYIWVDSQIGQGTSFEIYLAIANASVETPVERTPPREFVGSSQTILLAEDDGAVRRLARDVLARQGYTVLEARDGDEALVVARRERGVIHLLVTDVVMPGLSGRELATRLHQERPDVRVLYTSGYTERIIMRSGVEQGLTLLPKPFLPADLLQKVEEILGAQTAT